MSYNGQKYYREITLNALGSECKKCGETRKESLTFHHKDGNPRNNKLSNIEILCKECHGKEHKPESDWKEEEYGDYVKYMRLCPNRLIPEIREFVKRELNRDLFQIEEIPEKAPFKFGKGVAKAILFKKGLLEKKQAPDGSPLYARSGGDG